MFFKPKWSLGRLVVLEASCTECIWTERQLVQEMTLPCPHMSAQLHVLQKLYFNWKWNLKSKHIKSVLLATPQAVPFPLFSSNYPDLQVFLLRDAPLHRTPTIVPSKVKHTNFTPWVRSLPRFQVSMKTPLPVLAVAFQHCSVKVSLLPSLLSSTCVPSSNFLRAVMFPSLSLTPIVSFSGLPSAQLKIHVLWAVFLMGPRASFTDYLWCILHTALSALPPLSLPPPFLSLSFAF